jgi:hypothetical protein
LPALAGIGWGEGLVPQIPKKKSAAPLHHPKPSLRFGFGLSPQAGRGERALAR